MPQIQLKNPIFNAVQVDQQFLDNPPEYVRYIQYYSGKEPTVNGITIELGDWIVENETCDGELIHDVINVHTFDKFYEVVSK